MQTSTRSESTKALKAEAPALNLRAWKQQAEDYIREKPTRAAMQAALVGYTMHFFPLRTALAAVARLAVPGIFALGLYKVVDSFRPPSSES